MKKLALIVAMFLLLFTSCTHPVKPEDENNVILSGADKMSEAEEMISSMTIDEKIYQLMFVTSEALTESTAVTEADDKMKNALSECPVGGIILFADNIKNDEQVKALTGGIKEYSRYPVFIGVDEEGGIVSRAGKNPLVSVTHQPSAKEIAETGDEKKAYDIGVTLGRELSALGFNLDFAPVADILTNPDNTEIGSRAFGSEPYAAAKMVAAQVKGLNDGGVCAVLKHFPGHGSTSVNSHNGKSESARNYSELKESEFIPFKAGIESGAQFVMISHMTLTTLGEDVPSSLSETVITDYLKTELGFSGIVITDSLSMGAVTEKYSAGEAAKAAISAGADMLLMPTDFREAHSAIKKAVENGEISEERIDESLAKILKVKTEFLGH